jgi:hypothetical protein
MSNTSDPVNGAPHIIGATSDEVPHDTREVSHVIAYDVREDERPPEANGRKARWVWTVVTGQRAQELDARQAAVIIKALQWFRDHPQEAKKGPENGHGSTSKADWQLRVIHS